MRNWKKNVGEEKKEQRRIGSIGTNAATNFDWKIKIKN